MALRARRARTRRMTGGKRRRRKASRKSRKRTKRRRRSRRRRGGNMLGKIAVPGLLYLAQKHMQKKSRRKYRR